jgi:hypothetical protein
MNRYSTDPIICFLVINQIKEYPVWAIQSCLENCNLDIYLGYINEEDISNLPKNQRIKLLKLKPNYNYSGTSYISFDKFEFFQLVSLKWKMFQLLFELGYEHIIYTDLDVIWFRDVPQKLQEIHAKFPSQSVLIQDATFDPSNPRLCMGLISIKKNVKTMEMLQTCYDAHVLKIDNGIAIGDDDIITDFYLERDASTWIRLLPQTGFPVGSLLNAFRNKSLIPGLRPTFPEPNRYQPYIFHANFTVGERNKRLLIRLALQLISGEFKMTPKWRIILVIKRVRNYRVALRIKVCNLFKRK